MYYIIYIIISRSIYNIYYINIFFYTYIYKIYIRFTFKDGGFTDVLGSLIPVLNCFPYRDFFFPDVQSESSKQKLVIFCLCYIICCNQKELD